MYELMNTMDIHVSNNLGNSCLYCFSYQYLSSFQSQLTATDESTKIQQENDTSRFTAKQLESQILNTLEIHLSEIDSQTREEQKLAQMEQDLKQTISRLYA